MSRWQFPSPAPALHSRLPPPENALPGRPCCRAVIVRCGRRCSGTQGFSPHFSGDPSLLRLSLSCARGCWGSSGAWPRLWGSDSRGALCCPSVWVPQALSQPCQDALFGKPEGRL